MSEHEETAIASPSEKPSKEMDPGEIEDFENDNQEPPSSDQLNVGRKIAEPHPLENSWTFWFDDPSMMAKQVKWGSSLRPVHTFSTVEDFWSLYIDHPSKLVVKADFYCFKHNIKPKWEDPICKNGGKWTISCTRGKSDTFWLCTLRAMIGEQFAYGDEICGAGVNVRAKQERISIWTKNASNEEAQMSIGKQWKELLDYNESIGFLVHEDAKKKNRAAKNRYAV